MDSYAGLIFLLAKAKTGAVKAEHAGTMIIGLAVWSQTLITLAQ